MRAEISEGVFLIDTLAAGSPGLVAGYLIRGKRSALLDAGYPSSVNSVLSELKSLLSRAERRLSDSDPRASGSCRGDWWSLASDAKSASIGE